ncbi:YybH family protein [Undibacterium sp. Ji83W]|uniref:YybH family protein n=1 Tax=Undibacterium sp. Ji83W TaxID=3413043 RepID=UPI003BF1800B
MKAADVSKITKIILSLELGINERWNKGDVNGALEMYSEDVTYFDPLTEMRLEGSKAVGAYFRQFFEGKLNILRNEFPNPQVIVSDGGDLAVLHYNLINIVSDGQGGEKQGTLWNSTQVYRLIDGQWRVVHVNWSFTRNMAALQAMMS